MKRSGNTILVTGGGSGIGRALAQRWHDAGTYSSENTHGAAPRRPSPAEVCVARVRYFRDAERNGQFDEVLAMMVEYTPKG